DGRSRVGADVRVRQDGGATGRRRRRARPGEGGRRGRRRRCDRRRRARAERPSRRAHRRSSERQDPVHRRRRAPCEGARGAHGRAKEGAEDDVDAATAAVDLAQIGHLDALIGVAASGRTPYTVAAVRRAKERGAFTVGLANNHDTPLLKAGDVGVLLDTGPEVLAGSTRLAAGTAQKAALNALSTAVLVRLGGAYDNLMVGMRPLNAKLRNRAVEIVAQATGLAAMEAGRVLDDAQGDIRTAIVMSGTGASRTEAASLLVANGYSVRAAIAAGSRSG